MFLQLSTLGLGACFWPSILPARSTPDRKVIVVGAGVAGASAANMLRQAGHEVTVLEARNRSGGRIHTFEQWGFPIELGANWIHDAGNLNNPLDQLAEQLAVARKKTRYASFRAFDSEGKKVGQLRSLLFAWRLEKKLGHQLGPAGAADVSIQKVLDESLAGETFSSRQTTLKHFFEDMHETSLATDLRRASSRYYLDERSKNESSDIDDDYLVVGGYHRLVEHLLDDTDVQYGEVVRQIQQKDGRVVVVTEKATHEADHVIVTVPLEMLRRGSILFNPALPEVKQNALTRIRTGLFNKVVMRFSEKFWRGNTDFLAFLELLKKDTGVVVLNYHHYTREPILIALSVAAAAQWVEEHHESAIQQWWTEILHRAYPHRNIDFQSIKVTRWGADAYSRGSYSYVPVGATAADFVALATPVGQIHFAGEATIAQYNGTVHGAYLSGIREAQRIIGY